MGTLGVVSAASYLFPGDFARTSNCLLPAEVSLTKTSTEYLPTAKPDRLSRWNAVALGPAEETVCEPSWTAMPFGPYHLARSLTAGSTPSETTDRKTVSIRPKLLAGAAMVLSVYTAFPRFIVVTVNGGERRGGGAGSTGRGSGGGGGGGLLQP
jgi:hypothetical protein